jgi:hypothetical protein
MALSVPSFSLCPLLKMQNILYSTSYYTHMVEDDLQVHVCTCQVDLCYNLTLGWLYSTQCHREHIPMVTHESSHITPRLS